MTVVPIIVPGQVVVIITGGVAMELAWPGAGLEAATLSFVSVVPVVVVRERSSVGHSSAQSLALLPCHDGAELCQQPIAPVTQRVDVEILTVLSIRCGSCGRSCRPLCCCCRRGGRFRGLYSGSWCCGLFRGCIRAYNIVR